MAKRSVSPIGSVFFLQLALGAFFVVLGISDLTNYNSSLSELRRAFGRNETLALAMAIAELLMGVFLVLGLFMSVSSDVTKLFGLILFILWAVYIVVVYFANDLLQPSFLTWLYRLSWHSIILVALWIVGRRYV